MLEIRLPFPPSVNTMFKNIRHGRARTAEYEAWRENAAWELKAQNPKPVLTRAVVDIDLEDARRGDCDNRAKPVLDLLVEHGVLQGDDKKHVRRVSIGWEPIKGCRVTIYEAA